MNPKLKRAIEAWQEACTALRSAADAYENAPEDATQEQLDELSRSFDEAKASAETTKRDKERLEEIERARAAHPAPAEPIDDEPDARDAGGLRITEPPVYSRENAQDSFFLDMARKAHNVGMTAAVRERVEKHGLQMKAEGERRSKAAEARFNSEMGAEMDKLLRSLPLQQAMAIERAFERAGGAFAQKRAISRIDGSGGEFVPPVWMLDEYAAFQRAGRPFADACRKLPLPTNTDNISIPRITTGSLTGFQTQDNVALASQDLVTAMVTAPVRTIGGYVDSALQLLEQSPMNFDQLIYEDLFADMDLQIDTSCLNGSGGPGQFLGILNTGGIGSTTYTDASPTVPELYPKLAGALNSASNSRKRVPTHWWWASQRWFWAAKEVDTNNRPFFIAASNGPQNAFAVYEGEEFQGGPVTNVLGVPVYLDNVMPTNLGGGTNEDRIIATVMTDHILLEGDIRAEAFREPLSDKVGIRFRVYKYAAFTAGRYPSGINVISGTGLSTPSF